MAASFLGIGSGKNMKELIVVFFFKAPSDILRIIGCCLGVASSAEDAVLLSIMACLSFGRVDREVFVCGSQLVRVCDRKVCTCEFVSCVSASSLALERVEFTQLTRSCNTAKLCRTSTHVQC